MRRFDGVRGPFDSAWWKWGRAVTHAQALDAHITAPLQGDRDPVVTLAADYQPQRHGFAITVATARPLPVEWSLLLGDSISNLRASLDHLAWALVQRGATPNLTARQARAVYFPIVSKAGAFQKEAAIRLPGVLRADLAVVRRYQPYLGGKRRAERHWLSTLSRLVNSDKHREFQGLWMRPEGGEFKVEPIGCVLTRNAIRGKRDLLEVGAEVAFVHVRRTGPDPQLHVKYDLAVNPAISKSLLLQDWLEVSATATATLLAEFADPPGEVVSLNIRRGWLAKAKATSDTLARAEGNTRGR